MIKLRLLLIYTSVEIIVWQKQSWASLSLDSTNKGERLRKHFRLFTSQEDVTPSLGSIARQTP